MTGEGLRHDHASFEALYERTKVPILGYLVRRTGNAADAADLLAEVYLTAWRRLDDLPTGDDGRLWLYGVARRHLANHHRRADTQTRLVTALQTAIDLRGSDSSDEDLAAVIGEALATLDVTDREIIQLSVWEQLTPTEIGVVMGRSPGSVRVRLHRARRALRLHLLRAGHLHSGTPGGPDRLAEPASVVHVC